MNRLLQCCGVAMLAWLTHAPGFACADSETLAERKVRITSLSPAEKDQLQQQQQRFAVLPSDEQARLRELDKQLTADPRGDELRKVMSNYHDWLKNLHPAQREELRGLPPKQRLERVKQLRREQQNRESNPLRPEDRRAIVAWLEGVVRAKLNAEELRRWEQMTPSERQFALRSQLQKRANQPKGGRLPEITLAQLEELYNQLSPTARAELDGKPDPVAKRRLLGQWVMQTLRQREQSGPEMLAAMISQDELDKFARDGLNERQRNELERLGPLERQRRLRMMYLNWKYPERPWRELRPGNGQGPLPRPGAAAKRMNKQPPGSTEPGEGNSEADRPARKRNAKANP